MERRKLYTGEESAKRGLLVLRLAAVGSLLLTGLFILLFYRAKHDPVLAGVNSFAEDPYDAVGSFGVQLAIACAILSVIRAFRTDLKTESLYNRYTYTLRAMAVSQLAIILTMLADLVTLARYSSLWGLVLGVDFLFLSTGGMLVLASGFCSYLMRLAKRRQVCSQNPLRRPQIIPFLILLCVLGIYPGAWRDGIAGAILTAAFGMVFLLVNAALLSKAMFPCPDIPEKDIIDDLSGIYQSLKPRSAHPAPPSIANDKGGRSTLPGRIAGLFNPRKNEWNLLVLIAILLGFVVALVEIYGEGVPLAAGKAFPVAVVFILLESAGVFLGYAMLGRFLGLVRSE